MYRLWSSLRSTRSYRLCKDATTVEQQAAEFILSVVQGKKGTGGGKGKDEDKPKANGQAFLNAIIRRSKNWQGPTASVAASLAAKLELDPNQTWEPGGRRSIVFVHDELYSQISQIVQALTTKMEENSTMEWRTENI